MLFKTVKPVVKEFGKNVAKDVLLNNRDLKSSLKKRGLQSLGKTGKTLLKAALSSSTARGGGKRRRKSKKRKGLVNIKTPKEERSVVIWL